MAEFNIERFEAMVAAQTQLVRAFPSDAICEIEKGQHGYFCVSWVLGDRGARQLFVEQAGQQVTPLDLPGLARYVGTRAKPVVRGREADH